MSHLKLKAGPHKECPEVRVISMMGHLDEVNLHELKEVMQEIFQDTGTRGVVLDMGELEFLNSRVIGYLISLYGEATKNGRVLVILKPSRPIALTLERVGVDKLYPLFHKLDLAIAALKVQCAL